MTGRWSLSARIVSGVLIVVSGALIGLGITLASFTRFEVTERLDNSLQEVAERLAIVVSDWRRSDAAEGIAAVARVPHVDRRTLAYQVVMPDGGMVLRSQNAPERPFCVPLKDGFYSQPSFRVYVAHSQVNQQIILVGEPNFHRHEAVLRAVLLTLAPLAALFPIIWLLVTWIVQRSLTSVVRLRAEIQARNGSNLTPIPAQDLPPELASIQAAVNSLLARLTSALATERAFASNAAHELRNPIASQLAQAQLLQGQLNGHPSFDTSVLIVEQAKRIGRITDKLLQLSRAASGVAYTSELCNLVFLIDLLRRDLAKDDRIEFHNCGTPDFIVQGDPDAIGIMLRNLLENALNHSPGGSMIRIVVGPSGVVQIDNDCDVIDTVALKRLLEPFERGSRDVEGSGLGLAIVTSVARQLEVSVKFDSPVPTQNSGFRATLVFEKSLSTCIAYEG
ncbi:two component sensor histidine kinase [Neokomagataea thailandica NBRC 106555]|uniref:histidine kinase n=2 Tax=Neokomagataea TaxID=1223423 RepID=A0A4Y6VAT6_9PROT|nr:MULTISPECIES: ATP-binding protein [Neokomagataea]QDH26048.1 two-component sensor histidine kinase [Neokomagataea tanensis]GBR52356.1 two component sensor histidine kinase [Neokomagataea thailandica NBRC 106555]